MWSDTARNPRLVGPVDARVLVLFFVWAFHMRVWTFYVALSGIAVFAVLAWFGVSLSDAWGYIRFKISGTGFTLKESPWRGYRRSRM